MAENTQNRDAPPQSSAKSSCCFSSPPTQSPDPKTLKIAPAGGRYAKSEGTQSSSATRSDIKPWKLEGEIKLVQMFISYSEDSYIHSIGFQYKNENGQLEDTKTFGCQNNDGLIFRAVRFKNPKREYIERVSGSFGLRDPRKGRGLTSLEIKTNKGKYGPYGVKKDTDAEFRIVLGPDNQFAGFHGAFSPSIVTAIGIYVKPLHKIGCWRRFREFFCLCT